MRSLAQLDEKFLQVLPLAVALAKIALSAALFWIIARLLRVVLTSDQIHQRTGLHLKPSTQKGLLTLYRVGAFATLTLIALDAFGISITPILASLGVGSIVVGLALKDTLENFFSGVYVLADQPFRVGETIRTTDALEGTVEAIGWRSTRVITGSGQLVVIPNSKLASSIITNFTRPSPETTCHVELTLDHRADLARVESLALSAAETLERAQSGIISRPAVFRVHTITPQGIQVQIHLRVSDQKEIAYARHELFKLIKTSFDQNGVLFARVPQA